MAREPSSAPGPVDAGPARDRGSEHVVARTGRLRVGPVDAPVVLTAGDTASHRADREHVHEALGPGTTGLILTACPSPERGGTVG